jgi:uroporphyrinogen-III synthase
VAAVREEPIDCAAPVAEFVERLTARGPHMVIFLTGVGADAVFKEAERQERLAVLLDRLRKTTIVCRGPKPAAVVRRHGLSIDLPVAAPYTSEEVLSPLASIPLDGVDVTLVHYGERNARMADALEGRGAALHDLCVYEWRLPRDLRPLEELVRDILAHRFDAVIFTSQIQGRHLLQVADGMQMRHALVDALNRDVVVSAMGPVCRAALEELGIQPHVVPTTPKMAPLVSALADYFAVRSSGS